MSAVPASGAAGGRARLAGLLAAALALAGLSGSAGDEDGGSGFGGTGRTPGGSGLGGTGARPFLGLSAEREVRVYGAPDAAPPIARQAAAAFEPVLTAAAAPAPRLVAVHDPAADTRDSSPILVTEQIQRDLDAGARRPGAPAEDPAVPAEPPAAADAGPPGWDDFARYLADQADRAGGVPAPAAAASGPDRPLRPGRLQRPALPPVQHFRPVRPAAILPPRIRPLRL